MISSPFFEGHKVDTFLYPTLFTHNFRSPTTKSLNIFNLDTNLVSSIRFLN